MVDYSKWDKFVDDSDSDDDKRSPFVTRLESPSRVTIGPTGSTITTQSHAISQDKPSNKRKECERVTEIVDDVDNLSYSDMVPSSWTVNGRYCSDLGLYWSQSKEEVNIHIIIDNNIIGKDIIVSHHPLDRLLEIRHQVSGSDMGKLLHGHLKHDINLSKQYESESHTPSDICILDDWEVITLSDTRFISLTLTKRSSPSICLWWDRLFDEHDTSIDLSTIVGRVNRQETEDVWKEAHKMFRDRVTKITQKEVS
jgi:hypothetical protein